jgi:RNA polymerase sigma-70 factor (ECF subfamily)
MDPGQTQTLIRDALGGTDEEVGALLEHLRPRLVLWIATRMSKGLRAKVEPEDLAQDTLLAVHKALANFQGSSQRQFLAWFFRIAENRIRDQVSHFQAEKRQVLPPAHSFTQSSPSTSATRTEQVTRVLAAMEGLSPEHRDVIRLRRLEERGTKEIAELMERSENAVRILYCRALKQLRGALLPVDFSG